MPKQGNWLKLYFHMPPCSFTPFYATFIQLIYVIIWLSHMKFRQKQT